MPAHITHQLFTEDTLRAAMGAAGDDYYNRFSKLLTFFSQGPDLFYHNQRTKPSALKYGRLLHHQNYGTFVRVLSEQAIEKGFGFYSGPGSAILGFISHAILDRETHPYVLYHAGWVQQGKIETVQYFQCHPFLERIIDTILLEKKKKMKPEEYGFENQLPSSVPDEIQKMIVNALQTAFPHTKYTHLDAERIRNAIKDSLFFYKITEASKIQNRIGAYKRDMDGRSNKRRLAFFHPLEIAEDIDFLNEEHRVWYHHCDDDISYSESFMDLYERALRKAAARVKELQEVLDSGQDPKVLELSVGNLNLVDGFGQELCKASIMKPLPLPEMLEKQYREIAEKYIKEVP